jgi:hypothetical protein
VWAGSNDTREGLKPHISCGELLNFCNVISCIHPSTSWLSARNRGVILEDEMLGFVATLTYTEPTRMPQPHESTQSPGPGETGTDTAASNPTASDPLARASIASERSRFSQWLASFGLGEMPLPLLSRRRAQRG